MGALLHVRAAMGGPHAQMPALLFLLLFCNTFVTVYCTNLSSGTDDLRRLVGINLVLPHHREHYSYA
jgi:hypothetical protein